MSSYQNAKGETHMKSQRLPDTEFEIMTYIWDREPPVTTTMVMDCLLYTSALHDKSIAGIADEILRRGARVVMILSLIHI